MFYTVLNSFKYPLYVTYYMYKKIEWLRRNVLPSNYCLQRSFSNAQSTFDEIFVSQTNYTQGNLKYFGSIKLQRKINPTESSWNNEQY